MFQKLMSGVPTQCKSMVSIGTHVRAMSSSFTSADLRPLHKPAEPEGIVNDYKILLPYRHLEQTVGKNTRPRLLQAFNHWLEVPHDKLDIIHQISEILHNHLMLLDDVEDDTVLRRGIPVAHSIYGVGSTLNATNYVVYLALEKAMTLGSLEAVKICIEQMVDIHRGMGVELYWREMNKLPTEDEFIKMTYIKNNAMVGVPIRLMKLFSTKNPDLTRIVEDYSIYVQIKDDYTDLFSNDRLEYKHYCEDVAEGKYSYPIIHAISKENDEKVLSLVQRKPKGMELKKYTMDLLKKHGSVEYTLVTLRNYDKSLRDEIAKLGGNPKFTEILDEYAYLIE